jgi:hypothetical protein
VAWNDGITIYFFGAPLDRILNEGQKRCAEVRRVEDAEVRRGGRATARAKTKAKFGGPSTAVGMTVVCGGGGRTAVGLGRKVRAVEVRGVLRGPSAALRMTGLWGVGRERRGEAAFGAAGMSPFWGTG